MDKQTMIYLVLLLFAICLARGQYMVSKFNLLAPWSGYGAIQGVLNKDSDAPMVYRVLAAWIIGKGYQLWKYQIFMTTMIWLSLIAVYLAWGLHITLLSTILITITLWYDYWDWTAEMIGLSLALVSFPLALFGTIVHGLSRETAPLVGLVYALHSGNYLLGTILTLVALSTLFLVRMIQGRHKLYCKRWMILDNIELIKKGNIATWISIVIITIYLFSIPLRMESLGLLPLVLAGLTMAKINETRVFIGVIPYAALFLSGLL